jgi:hypothetical protein
MELPLNYQTYCMQNLNNTSSHLRKQTHKVDKRRKQGPANPAPESIRTLESWSAHKSRLQLPELLRNNRACVEEYRRLSQQRAEPARTVVRVASSHQRVREKQIVKPASFVESLSQLDKAMLFLHVHKLDTRFDDLPRYSYSARLVLFGANVLCIGGYYCSSF